MKHKTFLSWAAVIFWMAVIFVLSSQAAEQSDRLSTSIAENVTKIAERTVSTWDMSIKKLNYIVRKNAHFFSYLLLGVLMINALRESGVYGGKAIIMAFLACLLYAISDETHQLFVPGRGGQVKDVVIDSAGAAAGIGVYMICSKALNLKKQMTNDRG